MQDRYGIDSHKLMFHIERLNEWLNGKKIFPIYLEIAPSGSCNHRCTFCALDYLGYLPRFIDFKVLKKTIAQAATGGVKSVMYAGEGEPLLHKDICDIVEFTKKSGIDTAITSNGVLLKEEVSKRILPFLTWLRISLNAGTKKTYAKVHRTSEEDFNKVIHNLKTAVRIKKLHKLSATLGVQILLIPDNMDEVLALAKILKKIGIDYLTVKPYSQHPLSQTHLNSTIDYSRFDFLNRNLSKLESKSFKICFRYETMRRLSEKKDYRYCLGLPFWAYIDASGNVYACSAFLGEKDFLCGSIYKSDFKDIMMGKIRASIIKRCAAKLDVNKCREVCRLDKINSYLWDLKYPSGHINFI